MMRKSKDGSAKPFNRMNIIIRSLGLLLLLTLLSFHFVSGLYAKYQSGSMSGGGAAIAAGGSVAVLEHQAYFDTNAYCYQLNKEVLVTNNTYDVLVPGMDIEKDPFIRLTGDNDVSYTLYLEVAPTRPDILSYKMTEQWRASDHFPAQHGGKVYVFQSPVRPHEKRDIAGLLDNGEIHIKEELKDKHSPPENGEPFRVDMYAYLVQMD